MVESAAKVRIDRAQADNPLLQIFGAQGFSTDLVLTSEELNSLRRLTRDCWLNAIRRAAPEDVRRFEEIELDEYHQLSHFLDHARVWTTGARTYPAEMVDTIRSYGIFDLFNRECPGYRLASAMPPYGDLGRPRINWRLVRPGEGVDLGPIHADYWFDAVLPNWSPEPGETVRVKIWVPIFLEPGLTGFSYVPGSHLQEFNFESRQAADGSIKPYFDEAFLPAPLQTIPTPSGTALMFNYNLVHRGANSKRATRTRVSMELTLEVPRKQLEPLCGSLARFY